MEDMIRMLAQAPEEERRQMMQDRIHMFLSMPEERRVEAIAQLVTAMSKVKPAQRKELIKGRSGIIASLGDQDRKTIVASRMKAGQVLPQDIHQSDLKLTEQSLSDLPVELRQGFVGTMEELKRAVGPREASSSPSPGVPTHHGQPMVLKGLLKKNYVCASCGYKVPAPSFG